MKNIFLLWLLFVPFWGIGQAVDTAAVEREVDSLIQVSRTLTGKKDFEKALQVNNIAEKLAFERLGEESAAYGGCCFNRGRVNYFKGDNREAEKWYLISIAIWEKALGKEHPEYVTSLNSLAVLYYNLGQYKKAEHLLLEVTFIREKVSGKSHPEYAKSLNNLTVLYREMGQFEKAESLLLEATAIVEKALGKGHPHYGVTLGNLADLYRRMSQYEKAKPLFLQAIAILEKALGKEHPEYARSLNNYAVLYSEMGQYEKAEHLFLEALTIREKALGKEHLDYAGSLNNLALLYLDMGQYEKSEPFYIAAKAIIEKALGKENPDYARILNNLANLYQYMGQYEKAKQLFLESKTIREKTLGKEHPDYAKSLNNLAGLYRDMGQYEKAKPLYIDAKDILERALGKEHPDYAKSLNNLANLYQYMSQYEKAEPLFLESKTIREKVLGKEHPDYATNLNNLANLYQGISQYEKAEPLYIELSASNQTLIEKAVRHLSERELGSYLSKFIGGSNMIFAFTQLTGSQKGTLACYDNTLFHKGFLLQAANQTSHLALRDSVSTEKYYSLKGYRRRLAAQYSLPIAERDSVLIADLEEKANTLEKDLVRTVAGYGEALRQVKWEEVRDQLKKDQAAIEFVSYRYYDPKARATDSIMYAALVLLPTDTAPHFISLCEARQLEAIINQKTASNLYYQNIYNADANGSSPLYRLLWAPLEPYLQGIKTVYFSPSGQLHRLNLAAVQPVRRETLGDRYHLVVMGSTRNLVVPPVVSPAGNTSALFGGIQYEMDSTKIAVLHDDSTDGSLATRGSGGFTYTDSTLRGGVWNYLPATEKEIAITDKILKNSGFETGVYRDYAAKEEALQQIGNGKSPSPRVLHIATHGFFFPDPEDTLNERRLMSGEEPVFKISDNPMIRSGLLLAGSNYAWKTGKPLRPDMEDGILTAYEISQMNLRNTELVVLSACETGLGDIQGNEGVYGLQRAFKIAGAKYLLMSLWQVPDKHTQELMEAFYKNWLDGGKSIPEAFRLAQAEMRAKYPNPFYWAGFVLVE